VYCQYFRNNWPIEAISTIVLKSALVRGDGTDRQLNMFLK
jgi:hypothetical protein